jgi:hypothetical protein
MTDPNLVGHVVRETLARFALAPGYRSEKHDLQPHIKTVLDASLHRGLPGATLCTTISVGGTGKPSLRAYP